MFHLALSQAILQVVEHQEKRIFFEKMQETQKERRFFVLSLKATARCEQNHGESFRLAKPLHKFYPTESTLK